MVDLEAFDCNGTACAATIGLECRTSVIDGLENSQKSKIFLSGTPGQRCF